MPLHAQGERLQSAQREKAVERSRNCADRVLQKLHLIGELLVLSDNRDAADHVGVAVQVFRRGMNDHVEAEFDRPLRPRTRERVVGNADRVVRARDLRDRLEVDQLQQRIARRFHPDHPRVRLHLALDFRRIAHVDEGEIEIRGATAHPLEEAERAAVKIIAHEHVRAAVERVERSRHRRESRGKSPAARAALQVSDATLVRAAASD